MKQVRVNCSPRAARLNLQRRISANNFSTTQTFWRIINRLKYSSAVPPCDLFSTVSAAYLRHQELKP